MEDDEILTDDTPTENEDDNSTENDSEPTEVEILQEISNDIKYLIKSTIPNSVYVDWDYPDDEGD